MSSPDPDLDTLDPRARPIVERLVERKHANKLPRFSRRQAREVRGVSQSKQIRDEQAGEVLAYVSDGKVYVDPDSVFDKMARDAIASFPPGKPPAKIRRAPTSAFARKKRPRTQAQLAALRDHNERLRREAEKAAAGGV